MAKLKRAWMAFARRPSQIQPAILHFLMYVLGLGPLALRLRVFGRRDL